MNPFQHLESDSALRVIIHPREVIGEELGDGFIGHMLNSHGLDFTVPSTNTRAIN